MSRYPLLKFFVKQYRKKIAKQLFDEADGTVTMGPFKGMHINKKIHWGKADVAAKIYGLYESEILELIQGKKFNYLINLGAADGYYPVGMLIHSMVSHAHCFEENTLGKKYIGINADLNNTIDKVTIYGRADRKFFQQLPKEVVPGNNLVLCDIEGGEFEIFTSEVIRALSQSTFIIELHDFKFDDASKKRQALIDRFNNFNVEIIKSQPKKWSSIKAITSLNDNDRALICSEGRRVLGEWLVATPK